MDFIGSIHYKYMIISQDTGFRFIIIPVYAISRTDYNKYQLP